MKRFPQFLATVLCVITMTFLMAMLFIPQAAADNWSDCDGNGNGYRHSFSACVDARASAWDECASYRGCETPWWVESLIRQRHPFWTDPCAPFKAACDAANRLADEMCECDS